MEIQINPVIQTKIRELNNRKLPIYKIAAECKVSEWIVKKIIDPDWYEKQRLKRKDRTERDYPNKPSSTQVAKQKKRTTSNKLIEKNNNPLYDPRRDGPVFHTDSFSYWSGDPVPGRSALDQKRMAEAQSRR